MNKQEDGFERQNKEEAYIDWLKMSIAEYWKGKKEERQNKEEAYIDWLNRNLAETKEEQAMPGLVNFEFRRFFLQGFHDALLQAKAEYLAGISPVKLG